MNDDANTPRFGAGYGAEADDVWSVAESVLAEARGDGVTIPSLFMGMAHGEKARTGAFDS